jgi:hypothetical protein
MKINRAMEGQHGETNGRTQVERLALRNFREGFGKASTKLVESKCKSGAARIEHNSCAGTRRQLWRARFGSFLD